MRPGHVPLWFADNIGIYLVEFGIFAKSTDFA